MNITPDNGRIVNSTYRGGLEIGSHNDIADTGDSCIGKPGDRFFGGTIARSAGLEIPYRKISKPTSGDPKAVTEWTELLAGNQSLLQPVNKERLLIRDGVDGSTVVCNECPVKCDGFKLWRQRMEDIANKQEPKMTTKVDGEFQPVSAELNGKVLQLSIPTIPLSESVRRTTGVHFNTYTPR